MTNDETRRERHLLRDSGFGLHSDFGFGTSGFPYVDLNDDAMSPVAPGAATTFFRPPYLRSSSWMNASYLSPSSGRFTASRESPAMSIALPSSSCFSPSSPGARSGLPSRMAATKFSVITLCPSGSAENGMSISHVSTLANMFGEVS